MSYQRLSALLKEHTGINADSLGSQAIERAVRDRIGASGMRDEQQYFEHVASCAVELQELIERIVVPETWFFRDREAFVALVRIARERRSAAPGRGLLRALSLPCSTGEEPYSIAMALLDAGFAPDEFQIDAVDISLRAVLHAGRGVYGRNSFRGRHLGFRDRYFEPLGSGHRVQQQVREQVRLRHGNLFDMHAAEVTYAVIFCRNVLIYFERAEQQRALQILGRLLERDGVLFVGPSEAGLLLEHGFASARMPLAFAFRKADAAASQSKPRQPARQGKVSWPTLRPAMALKAPPPPQPAAEPARTEPASSEHWMETAQRLADAGDVAAALQHCELHSKAAVPSSEAFYLMGLLHDAAGRPAQAREHYRKALYLDPAHREALIHLAALLEGSGDNRGAQRLRARAQRPDAGGGK